MVCRADKSLTSDVRHCLNNEKPSPRTVTGAEPALRIEGRQLDITEEPNPRDMAAEEAVLASL